MPRNAVAYDNDFFAWTQEHARLLRTGELFPRSTPRIPPRSSRTWAAASDVSSRNRLTVLIMHLLKWHYQPSHRSPSWSGTIVVQRPQIDQVVDDRRVALGRSRSTWTKLMTEPAVSRLRRPILRMTRVFPSACPYTLEQILSEDFLPE